jgi:hypothetical protein
MVSVPWLPSPCWALYRPASHRRWGLTGRYWTNILPLVSNIASLNAHQLTQNSLETCNQYGGLLTFDIGHADNKKKLINADKVFFPTAWKVFFFGGD